MVPLPVRMPRRPHARNSRIQENPSMSFTPSRRFLPFLALVLILTPVATAQVPPDQQAEMILASARKAYTERNYPFAADRFREFLQKFGGHPKAADARYGLALVLLEQPQRQHAQAIE